MLRPESACAPATRYMHAGDLLSQEGAAGLLAVPDAGHVASHFEEHHKRLSYPAGESIARFLSRSRWQQCSESLLDGSKRVAWVRPCQAGVSPRPRRLVIQQAFLAFSDSAGLVSMCCCQHVAMACELLLKFLQITERLPGTLQWRLQLGPKLLLLWRQQHFQPHPAT